MVESRIFAESALLPDGWAGDVLFEIDESGDLARIVTGAARSGADRTAGPVIPGMPNLHSHAFQRAMAGLAERAGPRDDSFWTWREVMYDFVRRLTPVQVEAIAGQHATRQAFLTELTLDPPQATSDEAGDPLRDEDYLILSTVHSAKGQEWDSVYTLNVVDGTFPNEFATDSDELIEEERRLLYVAMTRAKNDLQLVAPLKFYVTQQRRYGERHLYGARSRFLTEGVLATLDQQAWPAASDAAEVREDAASIARIDAGAKMRSMWDE